MIAERFRIVALLGKGGMGEVYRADDVKLGQQVALKFLPVALASDAAKLDRLYSEVRLGRQVSHPNVCRVYDVMEWKGNHFISMEYIDGEDLASLLRRIGKLPHDKALDIARDLCAGLAAAHRLGIIHRDLKPANVMIDGRGAARITDFGLAALVDDLSHRGEIAGTPAYMAPEQIAGEEVTARTDLYALGLILYEIFTGKRLSVTTRSHSLSQDTKDLEPAVQRVILRCLEERVESRPPSIHAVIAALPGGDPLQAAVDAGETPSPEMVAAAGETGELRPAQAWALLIATILLIVINAALSQRAMLYGRVSLPKQPEALAERARDILAAAGYTQPPADTAYNLGWNNNFFESQKRPVDIDKVRPSPVVFYYRESPRELLAETPERRITPIDPPLTLSRMANVELDAAGRLIRFVVVPPEAEDPPAQRKPIDWSRFIADSGIAASTLRVVPPKWRVPVDSDEKVAWTGQYLEQPGINVRIEAASHHGRPIWFSIIPSWQKIDRIDFAGAPATTKATDWITALIGMICLMCAIFLARRNLRRSRGDRKGALRLAFFIVAVVFWGRMLRVDHVWDFGNEAPLLGQLLGEAVLGACVAWLLYIALEPYVRRHWPQTIISWTRLMSGRFRDPLVGRDLIFGTLMGLSWILVFEIEVASTDDAAIADIEFVDSLACGQAF